MRSALLGILVAVVVIVSSIAGGATPAHPAGASCYARTGKVTFSSGPYIDVTNVAGCTTLHYIGRKRCHVGDDWNGRYCWHFVKGRSSTRLITA